APRCTSCADVGRAASDIEDDLPTPALAARLRDETMERHAFDLTHRRFRIQGEMGHSVEIEPITVATNNEVLQLPQRQAIPLVPPEQLAQRLPQQSRG